MHSSPYLSIKALYSSFDNEGTMSDSTLWDLNLNVNVKEPITLSFSKLSCCFVPCLLHWCFICFKVQNDGDQRGWNALFGARTWEGHMGTMTRENQQLVTDEPVGVQDCRKITNSFRGIYRIYPNLIKEIRGMSRCNQLDLQTLGSQPVMPMKNLPNHCMGRRYSGLCTFHLHLQSLQLSLKLQGCDLPHPQTAANKHGICDELFQKASLWIACSDDKTLDIHCQFSLNKYSIGFDNLS